MWIFCQSIMNVNVIRFLLSRASGRRFFTHFEHFHTIADQTAEAIFVIGVAGCVFTVIPITAYRLLMVLFESKSSNTDSPPKESIKPVPDMNLPPGTDGKSGRNKMITVDLPHFSSLISSSD